MVYALGVVDSSEALLALPPLDIERCIAGAQWRNEREQDRMAQVMIALVAPYSKERIYARDMLGREPGESRIPGYRGERRRAR